MGDKRRNPIKDIKKSNSLFKLYLYKVLGEFLNLMD